MNDIPRSFIHSNNTIIRNMTLMLYKVVKIFLDSNGFLLSFSDTTRSFGGPSHRSKTKHRSKFAHQTLL